MAHPLIVDVVLAFFALYCLGVAVLGPRMPGVVQQRFAALPEPVRTIRVRRLRRLNLLASVLCAGMIVGLAATERYLEAHHRRHQVQRPD